MTPNIPSSMVKSDTSSVALVPGLVESVSDSGRGGLVDNMKEIEASDHIGVLSGSTLESLKYAGTELAASVTVVPR